MKNNFFFLFMSSITLFYFGCECNNGFRTVSTQIPRADWFPLVEPILANTTLRLNNYTPTRNEFDGRQEFAFFRPGNSSITLAGENFPLTQIDNEAVMRRGAPYTVYINDINSESTTVSTNGGSLDLTIRLEGNGTEVITDCINNIVCVEKPTVEINEATIVFFFTPRVTSGVAQMRGRAQFSANTTISLCNNNFFAFLCDMFGVNGDVINEAIETELNNAVNSPEIQSRLSAQLMSMVAPLVGADERLTGISILPSGDLMIFKAVPCETPRP